MSFFAFKVFFLILVGFSIDTANREVGCVYVPLARSSLGDGF
jgi:hypothetical protein